MEVSWSVALPIWFRIWVAIVIGILVSTKGGVIRQPTYEHIVMGVLSGFLFLNMHRSDIHEMFAHYHNDNGDEEEE